MSQRVGFMLSVLVSCRLPGNKMPKFALTRLNPRSPWPYSYSEKSTKSSRNTRYYRNILVRLVVKSLEFLRVRGQVFVISGGRRSPCNSLCEPEKPRGVNSLERIRCLVNGSSLGGINFSYGSFCATKGQGSAEPCCEGRFDFILVRVQQND